MTYDELKQKIRDYTEVSSTVLSDTIVNGFIEEDEKINSFIENYKERKEIDSKRSRRMIAKERKESDEIDKRFGLSSEDIENIFDLIEGGAEDV